MIRKDPQATVDQQFLDPGSYVTPDGRWVLKGEDYVAQQRLVCFLAGGRCEQMVNQGDKPWRCQKAIEDVHHRVMRSTKRDDRIENLEGLCRMHHNLKHPEKQVHWSKK